MSERLVLVDSSAWICFFNPENSPAVAKEVRSVLEDDRACFIEPVLIEVSWGAPSKRDHDKVRRLFSELRLFTVQNKTWLHTMRNQSELRKHKVRAPMVNLLMATQAIDSDLVVLHKDKHFKSMAKVLGFQEYTPRITTP